VLIINTQAQSQLLHTWILSAIARKHLVQICRIDGPTEYLSWILAVIRALLNRRGCPRRRSHRFSVLSDTMYLLIRLRKPPAPQNHWINISIGHNNKLMILWGSSLSKWWVCGEVHFLKLISKYVLWGTVCLAPWGGPVLPYRCPPEPGRIPPEPQGMPEETQPPIFNMCGSMRQARPPVSYITGFHSKTFWQLTGLQSMIFTSNITKIVE